MFFWEFNSREDCSDSYQKSFALSEEPQRACVYGTCSTASTSPSVLALRPPGRQAAPTHSRSTGYSDFSFIKQRGHYTGISEITDEAHFRRTEEASQKGRPQWLGTQRTAAGPDGEICQSAEQRHAPHFRSLF